MVLTITRAALALIAAAAVETAFGGYLGVPFGVAADMLLARWLGDYVPRWVPLRKLAMR